MLKIFAATVISLSFLILGRNIASMQSRKVKTLRSILLLISVSSTQIRYTGTPVSELLKFLDENSSLSALTFIKECRQRFCFGEPFSSAWQTSVENSPELSSLGEESSKALIMLGRDIGTTDLEGQLSSFEYYKNLFEAELDIQEEKNRRYNKVFPTLGVLLALASLIFIV